MNDEQVDAVANVLAKWNPLGAPAHDVHDLDGYRIEAADITFGLKIRGRAVKADAFIARVLNEAFDLSLDAKSCVFPTPRTSSPFFNGKAPDALDSLQLCTF